MSLISVQSLSKKFTDKTVVDGISFSLKKGECGVLLGPNGAGKSTTLNMLAGLLKPTSGSVLLHGKVQEDIRGAIGYLPQHPAFFPWMTGREALEFLGGLSGVPASCLPERAEGMLSLVGIEEAADRKIGTYSGGMKQRLGIAQAMLHKPELLIMDEPVSALDPIGRRELLNLIKEIKKETTILFSTHILHDAEELCDRIFIIHKGRLAENSTTEELLARHQQPVLLIQANRNIDRWAESLMLLEPVVHVDLHGNLASIRASDVEAARRLILKKAGEDDIPVQRFEIVQSSLEEIFLGLVK